jgi:hypothetical protein
VPQLVAPQIVPCSEVEVVTGACEASGMSASWVCWMHARFPRCSSREKYAPCKTSEKRKKNGKKNTLSVGRSQVVIGHPVFVIMSSFRAHERSGVEGATTATRWQQWSQWLGTTGCGLCEEWRVAGECGQPVQAKGGMLHEFEMR